MISLITVPEYSDESQEMMIFVELLLKCRYHREPLALWGQRPGRRLLGPLSLADVLEGGLWNLFHSQEPCL